MNDKLLRAFIEAQGLEIETTTDSKRTEITEEQGHDFIEQYKYSGSDYTLENLAGTVEYKRGDNGSYFKILIKPIIDYKVTSKEVAYDNYSYSLLEMVMSQSNGGCALFSSALSSEINLFLINNDRCLNEKD